VDEDNVKRDIQSWLNHNFPTHTPLSTNFNRVDRQENGTFKVSFVVTMNEGQRAGFEGTVGYNDSGQFVIHNLDRYF
jgi:hypothetical protein